MIETLNGIKETVNFTTSNHSRIHNNTICLDYPPHWHLELEIIIPIENCYDVVIANKNFHLNKNDILFINSGVVHSIKAPLSGKRIYYNLIYLHYINLKNLKVPYIFFHQYYT